jgi:S-adenosylmethionine/arginine decarboxylase-like enzyme
MSEEEQFGYRGNYGLELIADIRGCDFSNLTRESLGQFLIELVEQVKMTRHGDPLMWEDHSGIPHLDGISAVQFIQTSNVVCHALTITKTMYLNLFSCREFVPEDAVSFTMNYWKADDENHSVIVRV